MTGQLGIVHADEARERARHHGDEPKSADRSTRAGAAELPDR